MIDQIAQGVNSIEQQTNANATGGPQPPPPINALHVTANAGHFNIGINHEGAEFYRGIQYYVEHADNPQFTNSHTEELGTTRNANLFLGNSTRFFRAYAAYDNSHPGQPAYHGSPAQPIAVTGGGAVPGPSFLPSQGSGTGTPGQGHQGPGGVPYRSNTGKPPIR